MTDEPRPQRRRTRGRRRGPPRPQQAPAEPQRPPRSEPGRDRRPRGGARSDRALTPRDRASAPRDRAAAPRDRAIAPRDGSRDGFGRDRRPTRRGGRGRGPRVVDEIRPGTSCLILLDAREGEPDRSGTPALFEGYFDLETGEPRRAGGGIPRLRVGEERLWGFECWWRVDTERTGLTDADRTELETSKRMLRGLLRDSRRSTRLVR